jgi:ribA/ribD-fused uncharacterized protein
MMHQKALLFGDLEVASQILAATSPSQQLDLGRSVKNFSPEEWEKQRIRIVRDGNIAKFSQNEWMKQELFATYGTTLVQASPNDRIWGVGRSFMDRKIRDRKNWQGLNLLGEILTEVRDELIARESNTKPE